MIGWLIISESHGRKWSWSNFRYYPGFCLEGLRKISKTLSSNNRFPGRDSYLGHPMYEAGLLTTRLWCSAARIRVRSDTKRIFGKSKCCPRTRPTVILIDVIRIFWPFLSSIGLEGFQGFLQALLNSSDAQRAILYLRVNVAKFNLMWRIPFHSSWMLGAQTGSHTAGPVLI
jgi:hypothetical protein